MIILQIFVFDKTSHLVLRDSTFVHTESAPSACPTMDFFKVYSFVSCFLTVPLYRTKLKDDAMKLKTYVNDWAWCNIFPWSKRLFFSAPSAPWECLLSVPQVAHLVVQLMKDCLQTNKSKYVAMQLNTFLNFLRKVEPDVIWLTD